jgi:hypothetical protein
MRFDTSLCVQVMDCRSSASTCLAAGTIAAGFTAFVQKNGILAPLGSGLGLLLMLVSFVFWKLDQHTSFLIKHAETAIIDLEA